MYLLTSGLAAPEKDLSHKGAFCNIVWHNTALQIGMGAHVNAWPERLLPAVAAMKVAGSHLCIHASCPPVKGSVPHLFVLGACLIAFVRKRWWEWRGKRMRLLFGLRSSSRKDVGSAWGCNVGHRFGRVRGAPSPFTMPYCTKEQCLRKVPGPRGCTHAQQGTFVKILRVV